MKTAISIPDTIFQAAEAYAQEKGMSRSELYTRAIELYLQHYRYESVTETLDEIYAVEASSLESDLKSAQARTLDEETW
ncbi:hypothetical protein GC175_04575 [bacterium]|nr:hypothetical protein [bacterium]